MQALIWIVRLVIVLILVWFALKNSQQVDVYGFPGQMWQAPLVFVLLVAFLAGMVIGLLAWIPTLIRQRREVGRLKKAAAKVAAAASVAPLDASDPSESGGHGI